MITKLRKTIITIGLSVALFPLIVHGEEILYYTQDTEGLPEITEDERNTMDDVTDTVMEQDIVQFTEKDNNFTAVFTIDNPNFLFNGVLKEIDPGRNTKAIIKDGRTLVPIKAFIDEIGGMVHWENREKSVTIFLEDKIIIMYIGSFYAYHQMSDMIEYLEVVELDVPPVIINGRTMVPLNFVSTSLGFTVDWNVNTRTVTIQN